MKNKNIGRLGVVALVLTLVSMTLMGGTLAKYTTEVTGTGTATVAKWSFKASDAENSSTFSVSLKDTTLNSKVADDKIAPGTDGSFNIVIDATGSETALDYKIAFSELTNKPDNLKFYSDAAFTSEISDPVSYTHLKAA